MQLENLRIALRPRRPWEAIDLGVSMVQAWWPAVFGVWFAVSLPLFVLANVLIDASFWAALLIWWLKPLFDRPVLFVLSRSVFGETPSVRQTLRAAPQWLRGSGLLWHLTLGRIDIARSFRLPVMQLEGSSGKQRRARLRVLSARGGGYGASLSVIYIHIELFLYLGLFALSYLLIPQAVEFDPFEALLQDEGEYAWVWNLLAYLAMTLVEPFFVAGGFALYLNRRTVLEAWDLELNLRRLASRLAEQTRGAIKVAVVVAAGLLAGIAAPPDALAALEDEPIGEYQRNPDPQSAIKSVLSDPVFGTERTVTRWRAKNADEEKEQEKLDPGWLRHLGTIGEWLSIAAEGLAWGVAAAIGIALLVVAYRNAGPLKLWLAGIRRKPQVVTMPRSIAGLDLEADTLPDDIVAGARAAWANGEPRSALSLLYRGAIVALLRRGLELPESATEGDVVHRASAILSGEAHGALDGLVSAWLRLAYGHMQPPEPEFNALCESYGTHLQDMAAPA